MSDAKWQAVARALNLPPQQERIVELILRGMKDKQIADTLELSLPTVRTYLTRIFHRLEVKDRVGLVLHIFAKCHEGGGMSSK